MHYYFIVNAKAMLHQHINKSAFTKYPYTNIHFESINWCTVQTTALNIKKRKALWINMI